ncbi:Protocadherin Fat 1 [Anabarilius grahami]|uniref:Protocadherin Fat 1 n=1 Tax=Anabarilius grahami TaxID=495550 RepID=A0A3N0YKB0_ANAGA|nr:Protocadherin Fat 1 [Anabarilius grahami]
MDFVVGLVLALEVELVVGLVVGRVVEPVVDLEVEPVVGLEVKPVVGLEVEVEPVVGLEVEPVVELVVGLEVEPVVELEVGLEVEPVVGLEVKPVVGLEVEVEPVVELVVGLEVEPVVELEPVVGLEVEPVVELVVGLEAEPVVELEVEPVVKLVVGLEVEPVVELEINCGIGSNTFVGSILEGYEGDVEINTDISSDDRLVLEEYFNPIGVTFLELVYSDGDSTATVRTIKPLDADVLQESGGNLYYSVTCSNTGIKNIRALNVWDVNDNPPIFQSKSYSVTVSEATAVGSDVLRVIAEDADVSPENNNIIYSILPPAPDEFEVRTDGIIRLRRPLNYDSAQQYMFTVEAKDVGGLSDTTTVTITVEDFDNLNPYFDHSLYKASIEENQVGQFSDVTPEAIKAQDGDTGINEPVVYSITAVFPNEYQSNFVINQNSGVISVTTALDREEVDQISVYIQATQQDDARKTANTVVSVTIEDVNDNPPKFDQDEYTVSILENSPQDQIVLQTRVTDLDLTWCPVRSDRKVLRALKTTSMSRQLMWSCCSAHNQEPEAGLPSHRATQAQLEASVITTFLLEINPMSTPIWYQSGSFQRAWALMQPWSRRGEGLSP